MDPADILILLQTICFIFCIFLSIASLIRYIQKKNAISFLLFCAFLCFTISIIFVILLVTGKLNEYDTGAPIFLYINSYLMPYFLLSMGMFFLFQFSFLIFQKEKASKMRSMIALLLLIVLMVWGIYNRTKTYDNELQDFLLTTDFHTILYAILLIPSIIFNGAKLMKKVKDMDEYPRIRNITIMGIVMFLTVLFLVAETAVGIISGQNPNVFSFLAWPTACVSLSFAYLGFYKK